MRVDDGPGVLVRVADAALHAEAADDRQDDVLGVDAGARPPSTPHLSEPGLRHRQALGGQDVAHLARADPERDRPEGAVRRGVAVAARDGHAGLGQPELRADDVHDALPPAVEVEERHAEVLRVAHHVHGHLLGERIGVRPRLGRGRDDVVERGEGALGHAHAKPELAQHRERLRRGHLVDEVKPDEELGLAGRQRPDGVGVPNLVEQCLAMAISPRVSAGVTVKYSEIS